MHFKHKLAYMALGGFLVFLGQILPSIIDNHATAQQYQKPTGEVGAVFDEVTCQRLKIVDAQGKTYALLEKTNSGTNYSVIQVFDSAGRQICDIAGDSNGGQIAVRSSSGSASASIGINARAKDGRATVTNSDGQMQAWLMVDERGARITSR